MEELARGWRTDPDTLPILKDRARNDKHGLVRRAAVEELARGWRTDADTLPFLKERPQRRGRSTFGGGGGACKQGCEPTPTPSGSAMREARDYEPIADAGIGSWLPGGGEKCGQPPRELLYLRFL